MDMAVLEMTMAKKQGKPTVADGGAARAYPPEAYDYDDDVTPKGVAQIRERSGVDLSTRRVRLIDGFGRLIQVGAT